MKIIAIIPARGGSKGIPHKNLVDLNGYPLIYYTIREIFKVREINRVFVSTEDQTIKKVSEKFGVEIPFLRPMSLAQDSSRTIDVVIDVLVKFEKLFNETYDSVCLLQPTSPLRSSIDIENCLKLKSERKVSSVVSLFEIDEPHPYKMKIIKDGFIKSLIDGTDSSVPRQELPKVYGLNGAIYLAETEQLIKTKSFFNKDTLPYIMPFQRSININNIFDLEFAWHFINKNIDENK